MAGQSVLNELILEPQYNEGPRDWQNWLTKMNFHYVGVCFLYFTITGVKNIVQQQHFSTMTIPDFSCALHFSVWCKKGEGERRERTIRILLHLSLPLISHPFRSDVPQRLAVAFILTYSYWHTGRYCRSVKFNNGTFYESLSCWSDVCVKRSIVFYTNLCPCLVF